LSSENINEFEQTFRKRFPNLTEEVFKKYNYKLSIPQVQGEQLLNPMVILFREKGIAIKFHPNSIEKVVAS
jgi:predicted metalloenzyme YecM